ncbi:hypothetical protein B0H10DRAFT_2163199 [Mycena sp. CBHHK59/15]|nr:hypothetical protein B0H10DRAFT_2163199 [Mycena sp. CBHHK59/15]
MPPKPKTPAKAPKKEKVPHPDSRKAGQLARNALRKGKLGNLRTKRGKKANSLVELYAFFHHALPDAPADPGTLTLTLPELHAITASWSPREVRLEELRLRELETYRTGMEVPDLTHAPTLALFRKWDIKSPASIGYAHLLRFVRISSALPDVVVLSRVPPVDATSVPADGDEAPELLGPEDGMDVDSDESDGEA